MLALLLNGRLPHLDGRDHRGRCDAALQDLH
jgi:hypothetical protein